MPDFDLTIERHIAAPPEAVYRAWTEHTSEWFTPPPWKTAEVELELRAGGKFRSRMLGPDGEDMDHTGVFLEVIPNQRIVSTDAFAPGWQPQGPFMVAITEFIADGDGTLYRATARHWTAEARDQHQAMGFEQGWGTAAEQLEAVARRIA